MPRSTPYNVLLAVPLLFAAPLFAAPGWAQTEPADTTAPAAAGQDAAAQAAAAAGPPPLYEIAARARMVQDSAVQAERQVARLGDASQAESDLAEARRRYTELAGLFDALVQADYVRPERVSRLRDQVLLEDQRLETALGRVTERLTELGEMRGRWMERQRAWQRWRALLRSEPDYGLITEDMGRTIGRVDSVTTAVAAAMTELLSLQRDIEEQRLRIEETGAAIDAIRSGRRQALSQQREPILLSTEHRQQLADDGMQGWSPATAINWRAYVPFIRDHVGLLLFHLIIAGLIALLARRLQRAALPEGGWSGMLNSPWALGLLASSVLALNRVTLAPPLWDVLLWAAFGAAAAVLARRLFVVRALRLTVYLFASFYPVFLLMETLGLPVAVFRLVLAGVAAVALPVFAVQARRRVAAAVADGSNDPRRIWPLRIGALMWGVVLASVFVGYDLFGRWVLHATLTSAATVFVIVLLVALLRGAVTTLVRSEAKNRSFLRRIGVPFAHKLLLLLQAVLIFAGLLIVASVWELAPSPVAAWQSITGAGYTVGSIRLTVGRVLLGVVAVYIALVVSWLVRTFVKSEVHTHWDLDRGVGDSINKLVHYVLIILGILVALAILGVELQNFAIVAGALGIGIGFGLQNVVSNFVSGLILLFERPVRVGDTVVVDGEWGTIKKIGLRSTIMLTYDQSEMIVPNADFVSEKVVNWTLSNPVARIILPVGVAYGSDVSRVLEILAAAGFAHEAVLEEPPPQVLFTAFGDSSLDFELRVWVREIRQRLEVQSVVLMEVERRLAEAGIEIPFPQRDLHVRSIDARAADAMLRRPAGDGPPGGPAGDGLPGGDARPVSGDR